MMTRSHVTTIVATLALLTFGLGFIAHGQGDADAEVCPIDGYRVNPRTGKGERWRTWATTAIFMPPGRGDVAVTWDTATDVLRITGYDLQHLRVVGNVIDVAVIPDEEELP
jgi:hypothetical protein